jgi:hypothetical protein
MKLTGLIFVGIVACLISGSDCSAQMSNLFSGGGIRTSGDNPEAARKTNGFPNLMDFSSNAPEESGETGFFSQMQKTEFFRTNPFRRSDSGQPRQPIFGALPALFPKRDPSEPNFFEQINSKSKSIVDRTTNWAQEQNYILRARTANTWENLTGGFRKGAGQFGNTLSNGAGQVMPPQARTAENFGNQPNVKF